MISQTDIIKTLVNKNCTDESVLSTALSKDCTPTKLLEKLAESERFDLALDISMKSGHDTTPLWKTWAMRCLKNRNFQGAREKFRHCFPRLKLPGYRVSPVQSKLLADILRELSRMDETKLSLTDEIELIRNGKQITIEKLAPISSRPTIYAECQYYLNLYGSIEDQIRFSMDNSLWENVVRILIDQISRINKEKFFIGEVLSFANTSGQFGDFLQALLNLDPRIDISIQYFEALYKFCHSNRRYNLLYYIQSTINDYIAAADIQIEMFYLKKPIRNYSDLHNRIENLLEARECYKKYLSRLEAGETDIKRSSLFSRLPIDQIDYKLKMTDLQIEITRNFFINEVSGCINGIEIPVVEDNSDSSSSFNSPVTIFDKSERRRTFLAALVLIYFDPSCSSYLSKNGLEMATKIVKDYNLDGVKVFKTAMRIIIEDESCDILVNATLLLQRLKEDYASTQKAIKSASAINRRSTKLNTRAPSSHEQVMVEKVKTVRQRLTKSSSTSQVREMNQVIPNESSRSLVSRSQNQVEEERKLCDEIIRDAIGSCREPDYKMELAKLLSDEAKIELYIELGKLSNAQTLAFNLNKPEYVSRIIEEATRLNQNHIKTVCQLWLAKHEINS